MPGADRHSILPFARFRELLRQLVEIVRVKGRQRVRHVVDGSWIRTPALGECLLLVRAPASHPKIE